MAFIYFVLGLFFTYLAYMNIEDTIWTPFTLLLLAIATVDFGASYRYAMAYFRKKNDSQQNK